MLLESLYIEQHNVLKHFEIGFQKPVSILIGVNGSGKSTLLECVARIFSEVLLEQRPKFSFKLSYILHNSEILPADPSLTSGVSSTSIGLLCDGAGEECYFQVNGRSLRRSDIVNQYGSIRAICPSNIIIYYSGTSDVMREICEPHNLALSKQLRDGAFDGHRMFFYYDTDLFDLLLLSLLSFEFGDIPEFLRSRAHIAGVANIKITLKRPDWAKDRSSEWWGARGEVRQLFDVFSDLAKIRDEVAENGMHSLAPDLIIHNSDNEIVIVEILGRSALFKIRQFFLDEKVFFQVLNALTIDGFAPSVEFTFLQDESTAESRFQNLSEGEQQAIVIRGLIELVGLENSLYLFDEPDTFLHPTWQRKFVANLVQMYQSELITHNHFLITTHSPQFLSEADPEHSSVQIMERGQVIQVTPKYYGRDISNILYELMGVERRNIKISDRLNTLFNLIEDENLHDAKSAYQELADIIGEDDPSLVRARVQIEYLQEDLNEANSEAE